MGCPVGKPGKVEELMLRVKDIEEDRDEFNQ
jgi:hypothetical protein